MSSMPDSILSETNRDSLKCNNCCSEKLNLFLFGKEKDRGFQPKSKNIFHFPFLITLLSLLEREITSPECWAW